MNGPSADPPFLGAIEPTLCNCWLIESEALGVGAFGTVLPELVAPMLFVARIADERKLAKSSAGVAWSCCPLALAFGIAATCEIALCETAPGNRTKPCCSVPDWPVPAAGDPEVSVGTAPVAEVYKLCNAAGSFRVGACAETGATNCANDEVDACELEFLTFGFSSWLAEFAVAKAFENPCGTVFANGAAEATANGGLPTKGNGFEMCADTIIEVFVTSIRKHPQRQ